MPLRGREKINSKHWVACTIPFVRASSERRCFTDIKLLLQGLYDENADKVEQTLEEIGRVGKGNIDAMKSVQEFLRRERRMPLRILAMQTLSKIKTNPQTSPGTFKKTQYLSMPRRGEDKKGRNYRRNMSPLS